MMEMAQRLLEKVLKAEDFDQANVKETPIAFIDEAYQRSCFIFALILQEEISNEPPIRIN